MSDKIVRFLKKEGPINVNDPIERLQVLGKVGSFSNVKRENVNYALMVWSQQKRDPVINTDKERQEFAALVMRENFRGSSNARTPFARSMTASKNTLRKRKWTFEPSSGAGTRKFDNSWRGYLYADVKSKRNAKKLANLLRRSGTAGRVRVVPYQAKGRTYFSVYSQKTTDLVNKKSLKTAKKYSDAKTKSALNRRNFAITRKNLNKMGIKKRRI